MAKGALVTFEGIDGCGKSLMIKRLAPRLAERGLRVLITREPGGSALGRSLRQLLLENQQADIDQRSEALCFAADRAHHCHSVILPALEQGKMVLCDRCLDSTLAYQGYGRGLDLAALRQLNAFAMAGLRPDLTILLDIEPEQAAHRRTGRPDRIEQEQREFFRRVVDGYRELAAAEPERFRVIPAQQGIHQVSQAVWTAVLPVAITCGQAKEVR